MSRAPRTFDPDALHEPAAPMEKKPERPARPPRALDLDETFVPLEAELAQRLDLPEPDLTPELATRRWSALSIALAALGALASLAAGLAIDGLIRDLAARADWLGWLGLAFTLVLVLALLVLIGREAWGFVRLARIEHLRERANDAYERDDAKLARAVVGDIETLFGSRPATAQGRKRLAAMRDEIVDGRDLLAVAEQDLLSPLDREAQRLALGAAKRVSVVTAVSPRALVDVLFVAQQNLALMRAIAQVYGGRPGRLSFWRLARRVLSHLAVTGSIAVGDGLIGQVVGHGLASRLSARFGEGVVNGLLTARVGLAAMDVCRPLPFRAVDRPGMGAFLDVLMRGSGGETEK